MTATFGVEENGGEQILDVEILVPLNNGVSFPDDYILKKEFRLYNAIYTRYEDNPMLIHNVIHRLVNYINEKKYQQVTAIYNVQLNELQNRQYMYKNV